MANKFGLATGWFISNKFGRLETLKVIVHDLYDIHFLDLPPNEFVNFIFDSPVVYNKCHLIVLVRNS